MGYSTPPPLTAPRSPRRLTLAEWVTSAPETIHAPLAKALERPTWRWEPSTDGSTIEAVDPGTPRAVHPRPVRSPAPSLADLDGWLPDAPESVRAALVAMLGRATATGAASLSASLAVVPRKALLALVEDWQHRAVAPERVHVIATRERKPPGKAEPADAGPHTWTAGTVASAA